MDYKEYEKQCKPPKAVIYRFVRVFKQVDDARCEGIINRILYMKTEGD